MSERRTKKKYSQTLDREELGEVIQKCYDDVRDILKGKTRKSLSDRRTSTVEKTARCPRRLASKTTSRRKSTLREALTKDMEREIHSAYYRDGGFRFFGCNFTQYVSVNLPYEKYLNCMWSAGYNTCLNPMINLKEKLDKKLEVLQAESDVEPLELENQDLWDLMAGFCDRVRTDKLDLQESWETEDYRQALQSYCEDLNQKLLNPYHPPED